MQYAPIALFTYNRPDKTRTVMESLLQNAEAKDSDLFIFSDGPKNEKAVEGVKANREYLHSLKDSLLSRDGWGGSITIIEREENMGLANSLVAGITQLCDKYGRVIVVEDDLILSPYFLKFMNDGLNMYADVDKVGAISAFLFPQITNAPETFLVSDFACWGWATWKRAWDLFNPDASDLLRQLRWKKYEFNMHGSFPAYEMLVDHKRGNVNSWAIRFAASLFLAKKLVLYPTMSLVKSNGLDGSGVHCGEVDQFAGMKVLERPLDVNDIKIENNTAMYNSFVQYYRINSPHNLSYYYKELKSLIRRICNLDC